MIRCIVQIIPGGDESKAREVGMIEIANDDIALHVNSGGETGDYRVMLRPTDRNGRVCKGRVVGFPRREKGVYDLLYLALEATVGHRNRRRRTRRTSGRTAGRDV